MAGGARHKAGSSWAIAVSGIAGPDGGTAAKPVGTVWIAWAGPAGIFTERYVFNGSREAVRTASIEKALYGLIERVELATRQAAM
jgi:nicotinamide-nucleotide amidase